ncbi:MAG: CoA ester lyase [Chloroflexi bacterium]|nr:CoA ester lyase [Chloroflexota bacterium]
MLRSLLFVPGNRAEMLLKARNLPADVLIPDLEDAVPMAEKEKARKTIAEALPALAGGGQSIIPRTNSLASGLLEEDLAAVMSPHIFGVTVGKVETAWEAQQIVRLMEAQERRAGLPAGSLKLIPWIETAKGIVSAQAIASSSPRIVAIAFGAEDFTNDMGVARSEGGEETAFARTSVAIAARAADVLAIDTPYTNFRDPEGLKRDVLWSKKMGFKGKCAIHPAQIETINELFSPAPAEVEYARKVVKAFEEAEAQGRGTTSLEGKMIDAPIVKRARALLALAEAIENAQKARTA